MQTEKGLYIRLGQWPLINFPPHIWACNQIHGSITVILSSSYKLKGKGELYLEVWQYLDLKGEALSKGMFPYTVFAPSLLLLPVVKLIQTQSPTLLLFEGNLQVTAVDSYHKVPIIWKSFTCHGVNVFVHYKNGHFSQELFYHNNENGL